MLEQINEQLKNPSYLNSNSNYLGLTREKWPRIGSDLYPLTADYFHSLNPFYSYNAVNFDFFASFPVVTLRDGAFSLGTFFCQSLSKLMNSEQTILVHEDCEQFVPDQLKSRTLSYKMTQPRRIEIHEAKTILMVGVISDQVLEDIQIIKEKIDLLSRMGPKAKLKIYLQTRKNPFELLYAEPQHTNSFFYEMIKDLKVKPDFITSEQLAGMGFLKETYVINLTSDNFINADSFTDFILASKGATIHEWSEPSAESPLLTVPISLFHRMDICEIKKKSIFNELVFLRKRFPSTTPLFDPYFYAQVKYLFNRS